MAQHLGAVGLAVVTAAAVTLTACAAEEVEPAASVDPEWAEEIAYAIESARQGGAGDDQLEVLEQIALTGEVTLEQARSAARSAVACLEEGGGYGAYEERTEGDYVIPGFSGGSGITDPDGVDELFDTCYAQESLWIDQLYQTQPIAVQAIQELRDQYAPALRACLENKGYEVADEATTDEILVAALKALEASEGADDCISETGFP